MSEFKEVASLWLSPSLRSTYREQTENRSLIAQFAAHDIPTLRIDLLADLQQRKGRLADEPSPPSLKQGLLAYVTNHDVVRLHQLKRRWQSWSWSHVIDQRSGQSYLLIAPDRDTLPALVNLAPRPSDNPRTVVLHEFDAEYVADFIDSRANWLEFRPSEVNQWEFGSSGSLSLRCWPELPG